MNFNGKDKERDSGYEIGDAGCGIVDERGERVGAGWASVLFCDTKNQ